MVLDFNREAAGNFVQALLIGDHEGALGYGLAVTNDPEAVNFGVSPDPSYNDEQLANLIEENLAGMDRGLVNMTFQVYMPIVVGAICYWVTQEVNGETDGETDRQPVEPSKDHDPSGP